MRAGRLLHCVILKLSEAPFQDALLSGLQPELCVADPVPVSRGRSLYDLQGSRKQRGIAHVLMT